MHPTDTEIDARNQATAATPQKHNMTMEKTTENGDVSACYTLEDWRGTYKSPI